jgi:hypothetical protein
MDPMNPFPFLDRWAVASQQGARRNAMIAATALAQRRAELADVEDYLRARTTAGAEDAAEAVAQG